MSCRSIIEFIKKNKTLIVLLTLSVLGMTLSFVYYRSAIKEIELNDFKASIKDHTRMRLESTKDYISDVIYDLNEVAETIAEYDSIWDPDVSKILVMANRMDDFKFTSVVDQEGNGYSHTGIPISVSDQEYFKTAMQGNVAFSEVRPSKVMPEVYVQIFACPIWSKDHQVVGVVLGVLDLEDLNQAIQKKHTETRGNLYIVDSNGNYISRFQPDMDESEFKNFWDDVDAITVIDREISEMKEDFEQRKEGEFSYYYCGEHRYGCYMPIGTRNWQIVFTMQDTSVGKILDNIYSIDTKHTILLNIFYLIWVFSIAWYFRKINKEMKHAHQEVSNNMEILHIALEYSKQPIFEYNQNSRELVQKTDFPNPIFQGFSGRITPENIVEKNIIAAQSVTAFLQLFKDITIHPSAKVDIQINHTKEDTWCRISLHNIYEGNIVVGTVGFLEDITELKRMELQSKQKQELQDALIAKALLYAKVDLDSGFLLEMNGKESQRSFNLFVQKNVVDYVYPKDIDYVSHELSIEVLRNKFQHGVDTIETQFRMDLNGSTKWVSCTEYCHPANPSKMILIINDIDQKKRKEIELRNQAERDGLTGLYNATTTRKKIEEALACGYQSDEKQVFVLLDLDNYKLINDTFGHIYGDQVLVDVAQMMKKRFRSSDIIGRMGGDEFVIFLRNIRSYQYVGALIQELCDMIYKTYTQDGQNVTLSASVGVTWAPLDGHTFAELYQKSDIALYQVKKQSKNGYKHYDTSFKEK